MKWAFRRRLAAGIEGRRCRHRTFRHLRARDGRGAGQDQSDSNARRAGRFGPVDAAVRMLALPVAGPGRRSAGGTTGAARRFRRDLGDRSAPPRGCSVELIDNPLLYTVVDERVGAFWNSHPWLSSSPAHCRFRCFRRHMRRTWRCRRCGVSSTPESSPLWSFESGARGGEERRVEGGLVPAKDVAHVWGVGDAIEVRATERLSERAGLRGLGILWEVAEDALSRLSTRLGPSPAARVLFADATGRSGRAV